MCCPKRIWRRVVVAVLAILAPAMAAVSAETGGSATKPAGRAKPGFPYVGEVTGSNVYVRSMPDQNWYPTTKLNRGDRVEVHDEQFAWLKIRPPRGSFCYIDKAFVIRDRQDKGIVDPGEAARYVYVRAGSELPEFARKKTCVVTKLGKGAEVRIISEHPDGYYRIVPPEGAFYWISRRFVRKVGEGVLTAGEKDRPGAPPITGLKPGEGVKEAVPRERAPGPRPAPVAGEAPKPPRLLDAWQKRLDLVDAELKAALRRRPLRDEDFRALRKRFLPIAEQNEEDVPKQYAKIRLGQIDDVIERIAIRARLDEIAGAVRGAAKASATRAARRAIRPDYEGKLVRSFAFEGRCRIVEPSDGKTLVYLEFPPDSGIDPKRFLGRYVKVRAKSKRYDKDLRRNIVVPAEIVVAKGELRTTTGPVGPPVPAASANQPAGLDTPE